MKLYSILTILVAWLLIVDAKAGECDHVIALARDKITSVASSEEIKSQASNFCANYDQYKSSGNDRSIGASYKFLAATLSSSSRSYEDVKTNYCSLSSNYTQYKNDYATYVDQIAPGAMAAYTSCMILKDKGVRFTVEQAGILPNNFAMFVSFFASGSPTLKITVTPVGDVECNWIAEKEVKGSMLELASGNQATLRCSRKDSTKEASIAFAVNNGNEHFILKWGEYNKEGIAIDSLRDVLSYINELKSKIDLLEENQKSLRHVETGILELNSPSRDVYFRAGVFKAAPKVMISTMNFGETGGPNFDMFVAPQNVTSIGFRVNVISSSKLNLGTMYWIAVEQ